MPNDTSIPTFLINTEKSITISIDSTQTARTSAGNTYNQAGLTYNEPGAIYEGITNANRDTIPILSTAGVVSGHMQIPLTDAMRKDQGYAYNQAGFTYNQQIAYGGLANSDQDLIPMQLTVDTVIPHNLDITDSFTTVSPIQNTNHSVGPGWFLFVTIP